MHQTHLFLLFLRLIWTRTSEIEWIARFVCRFEYGFSFVYFVISKDDYTLSTEAFRMNTQKDNTHKHWPKHLLSWCKPFDWLDTLFDTSHFHLHVWLEHFQPT